MGPVFSYVAHSADAQYDLGTAAVTAQSDSYFCYGDAYANLTASNTVTSDGAGTLVAQKVLANSYVNDTADWYLGRLKTSGVQFVRPGVSSKSRMTSFTYDITTWSPAPPNLTSGQ